MLTFGQKLKREREIRETPLEQVATRTKIGIGYLEALERNEFDALPGPRAFGKLYIRAYAEMLGFDPRPLIAEYDKERYRRVRQHRKPRQKRKKPDVGESETKSAAAPPEPAVAKPSPTPAPAPPKKEPAVAKPSPTSAPAPPKKEPAVAVAPSAAARPARPKVEPPRPTPAPEPPLRTSNRFAGPRTIFAAVILLGAMVLTTVWFSSGTTPTDNGQAQPAGTIAGRDAIEPPAPSTDEAQPAPQEEPPAPATQTTAAAAPAASNLTVSEFGVGSNIVNHRLVGESERFEEGQAVWFATRVLGAAPGETVRHVWFRDGKPVQSITLSLGGSHWRTHSKKTLWGVGSWAVEARGPDDRVLARAAFTCVPRGS